MNDDDLFEELMDMSSEVRPYEVSRASKETYLKRYSICSKCEFLTETLQCSLVDACFRLVEQIKIEGKVCPDGRW